MSLPTVALDARLIGSRNTGDSTYWAGLLYGLANLSPRARILLISNTPRPETIPNVAHIEWVYLPSRSTRWWSYVSFPLAGRRRRAHAIHTQYSLSPLVGKRGFTTIHDVSFFLNPEWFRPKDRFFLRKSVPHAVKRAQKVFAVSQTSRLEIEKAIPTAVGKTVVTYDACPPWTQRIERDQAAAEIKTELGVDTPFLLSVGTRWPRKNMELAIAATDLLDSRFSQRLLLTGKSGWGAQGVGTRGKSVGYVSDHILNCLYCAADLYLAPSLHEGFGIPVLEAFRCGCPVLCSSGGALPEVAAQAAKVEPSWNPLSWKQSIESLLDDSSNLQRLREAGYRREREFSWEDTARRTLDAYLGALD